FPVATLVRTSFAPGKGATDIAGWSLVHYRTFFGDPFYLGVVGETLLYGAIVTVATAILGFPVAYALARAGAKSRRFLLSIPLLPLTLSLIVNVFGWIVILGRAGLVNNLLLSLGLIERPLRLLFTQGAVLFVIGHTFFPFQVLSMLSVISQ